MKLLSECRVKTICEPLTIHVKDAAHEAYLESSQTYMMKFFGENSYCHGSKYASDHKRSICFTRQMTKQHFLAPRYM